MCPRQESNLRFLLRREVSYPLYDEDVSVFCKKPGDPLRYSFVRRHRGPGFSGALGRNRTYDLLDRNQTLYPLSYKRKTSFVFRVNQQKENKVKYAAIFRECQLHSGREALRLGVHEGRDEWYRDRDRPREYVHERQVVHEYEERADHQEADQYE